MARRSPDDIVFAAEVEDNTISFFERFDRNVDNSAQTAASGFSKVDQHVNQSASMMGVLAGAVGGVTMMLVDMAMKGVAALSRFAQESVTLAGRADTLEVVMMNMAETVGYTREEIQKYEEDLEASGITTVKARESIIRMMRAQLDLEHATTLSRLAQNAAVAEYMNSSEAFARLIEAIQRGDRSLLKVMGITFDYNAALREMANSVGKSTEELTQQQRTQAFMNAILKEGEKIQGSYTEAMETAFKAHGSVARHVEQLQLALGQLWQPAYKVFVEEYTETLKDLRSAFVDSEGEIREWVSTSGEILGNTLRATLNLLQDIADILITIPGYVKTTGDAIAKWIGTKVIGYTEKRMEEASDNVGKTFRKMITIVAASILTAVNMIADWLKFTVAAVKLAVADVRGDTEEIEKRMEIFEKRRREVHTGGADATWEDMAAGVREEWQESIMTMGEFLEVIDDPTVEEALGDQKRAAEELAAALEELKQSSGDLFKEYQMEIAEKQLQREREAIERMLKTLQKMEDIERKYQERISEILQDAEESRADALLSHHEDRISIIRDYQRRVADIRDEFNREAYELQRERDAVGLMRLIRRNKARLEEEEESRDERLADAEREYQRELRMIERTKREQLEAARERRAKDYEDLNRHLERERELRELHEKWEKIDREEKYREKLEEMAAQYIQEEDLTAEHLRNGLRMWSEYYTNISEMISEWYRAYASVDMESMGHELQRVFGVDIIGQGGLVSGLLAGAGGNNMSMRNVMDMSSAPSSPPVSPSSSKAQHRHLTVDVRGDALDPIIQRELVRGLLEIERNRGV